MCDNCMTIEQILQHSEEDIDRQVAEYLAHYGVKGMKWGVIRDQNEVIRRAQAMKDGTEYKKAGKLSNLKNYADRQRFESGDHARDYVKAKAYLEGKEHSFKVDKSLAGKKSVDELMKDVVAPINPEFGAPGTVQNCRRATLAYEMRRRGMDVKATYTTNASGQHIIGMENALTPGQDKATRGMAFIKEVNKKFQENPNTNVWGEHSIKDPDFDIKAYKKQLKADAKRDGTKTNFIKRNTQSINAFNEKRAANIQKELLKQGEGARGEFSLGWMLGGGHSVAYENVGGKAVIFDNQSGKKYTNPKQLRELIEFAGEVGYTRLDNRELNVDYLRRWVQDA